MGNPLLVSDRHAIRNELRERYGAHKGIEFAERVVAFCDDSEIMEARLNHIDAGINRIIKDLKGAK